MSDLVARLLAEALERAKKAKAIEPTTPSAPSVPEVTVLDTTEKIDEHLAETLEAKKEVEEKDPSPIVSLIYQSSKGPVTPGLPPEAMVDLETYNLAYTAKLQDIMGFERQVKTENPTWDDKAVERAVNDYIQARKQLLDKLMCTYKLEWVMSWRIQEERLKISSEAERERIRKSDREYRVKTTDGPKKTRAKKEPAARVVMDPAKKKEAGILLMMQRLGMTRQAAEDRMNALDAIKVVAPEVEPDAE